jgi:hypothetical protein
MQPIIEPSKQNYSFGYAIEYLKALAKVISENNHSSNLLNSLAQGEIEYLTAVSKLLVDKGYTTGRYIFLTRCGSSKIVTVAANQR